MESYNKQNKNNSNKLSLEIDEKTSYTYQSCALNNDSNNLTILGRLFSFLRFDRNSMLYNESDLKSNGGPY